MTSVTLPSGWALTTLGEVTSKVGSGATPRGGEAAYKANGIPLIRSMNVHFDGIRYDGLAYLDAEQARALDGVTVIANDVLLNITGASIGRVATAPADVAGARVNQHVAIIRLLDGLVPSFVSRWLASPGMQRVVADEESGATRQALTKDKILSLQLPVPPLNEQRRIVAKLDAIFEQTRAAKARLERLPALAERLKRSILAAAFCGQLTEDWRQAHPDVAPVLPDRLCVEHRVRWENGLRERGKDPGKAMYAEPSSIDASALPPLPHGWCWTSAAVLVEWSSGKFLPRDAQRSGDVPVFGGNGANGTHNVALVDTQSLVIGRVGANCGNVHLAPARCWVTDNAIYSTWVHPSVSLEFAALFLSSRNLRQHAAGTGQPYVSQATLDDVVIAVPPLAEQRELVARVHEALALVSKLLQTCSLASARLDHLERAALAKAFRGELVLQEPTDEPASVLLERIRAARTNEPAQPRRARRRRSEVTAVETASPASNGQNHGDGDEPLPIVVGMFQLNQRLTASAISEATGLEATAVKKALKTLVESGQLRVEGHGRRIAYVWTQT